MMRPLQGIEHPGWGPYNLYHSHTTASTPNAAYVRHDPDNMVDDRRREVGGHGPRPWAAPAFCWPSCATRTG